MATTPYQPGDRVRARASNTVVPAGTLGTVVQEYSTMRNAYEVRLDGQRAAILMWADELERADRPAEDTPQP
jgi:hypothetical protein